MALLGFSAPVFWIAGAGVMAGLGGIVVADRRAIGKGLRELEAWGFPVEGYREWLLADEPTFDVDLKRDVDVETISSSVRALDTAIVIERAGERRFRVITRRVAMPSKKHYEPAVLVGDRRLLHELYARILAPLHADVGIVAMRMGDRQSMQRLLPAPAAVDAPPSEGMGAFRETALVAPPALQALMRTGTARELPHEARRLSQRVQRVVYASGSHPLGVGTVIGLSAAGAFSGVTWALLPGMAIGAIAGLGFGIATVVQGNRRNANRVAAVYHQPFPIEGYDDWLLSGRPLLDIELAAPIERDWLSERLVKLRAFSVGSNTEVPWVLDVQWLDELLVRIETWPSLVQPDTSRIEPFYGGSSVMFAQFVTEVLVPLHARVRIKALRMGGYIDRRV